MKLFKNRDNIHFSFREIDGYNRPLNAVISPREPGKSTAFLLDKVYKPFIEEGKWSIIIYRQVVEINETVIQDLEDIINKFLENPIKFTYARRGIDRGIVDVYVEDQRIFRLVALSLPMRRLKGMSGIGLKNMIFDEFIINPKFGEKYLKGEWKKFEEFYTTLQRECAKYGGKLKVYLLGNPYSKYNPYFAGWHVKTSQLKSGTIQAGNIWAVQCYKTNPKLLEKILERNPLYQLDDEYKRYAFDGESINDAHIQVAARSEKFSLRYIFRISGKELGVFRNANYVERIKYHVEILDGYQGKRNVLSTTIEDLVDRTALVHPEDKRNFDSMKRAFRERRIDFNNIECYYLFEEIYLNL